MALTLEEKVWGRKREQKEAPLVSMTPRLIEVLRAFNGNPATYGQLYRELAPVRTVVDFLADAIASTPLKVYRRAPSGRPEARNHPLAQLLRHPNSEMDDHAFKWVTAQQVLIYGNAFWRKMEQGSTRILVPIPAWRVTPRGGTLLAPDSYDVWNINGRPPTNIPREEMAHFRIFDPEDFRIGVSKLQALVNILNEEIAMGRFREGFWANAARIEGVLEQQPNTPPLSDDAYKRLRADWENMHTGENNSGRTAILEGFSFKPASFSSKDAEYIEGRQFILEATARTYNIPLSVMGLTDTPTYASATQQHIQLYQDTLPPWYELIQSGAELQLLSWFENEVDSPFYVEFEVEGKIRGSFQEQAEWLSKLTGRPLMEVAEGRSLLNLPDRGDPTDHELAVPNANFVLESVVESGQAAPANPARPAEPPALPSGKALRDFFVRQESAVLGKIGAGVEEPFDTDRWDRELATLIDEEQAKALNGWTRAQLQATSNHVDRRAVFARLIAAAESL